MARFVPGKAFTAIVRAFTPLSMFWMSWIRVSVARSVGSRFRAGGAWRADAVAAKRKRLLSSILEILDLVLCVCIDLENGQCRCVDVSQVLSVGFGVSGYRRGIIVMERGSA